MTCFHTHIFDIFESLFTPLPLMPCRAVPMIIFLPVADDMSYELSLPSDIIVYGAS